MHHADLDRSWFATNDADREKMRKSIPRPTSAALAANERFARNGFKKVSTDMAVPLGNCESLLRFYDDVLGSSGLEHIVFGHIGDCHLHANIFPKDEAEAEKACHIYGRCIAGRRYARRNRVCRARYRKIERKFRSDDGERYLNEMTAIKKALDPNGILGRGEYV